MGHFLTSVKFCEIKRKYKNSMEKGKFRGSTQNSVACEKLWALVINLPFDNKQKEE